MRTAVKLCHVHIDCRRVRIRPRGARKHCAAGEVEHIDKLSSLPPVGALKLGVVDDQVCDRGYPCKSVIAGDVIIGRGVVQKLREALERLVLEVVSGKEFKQIIVAEVAVALISDFESRMSLKFSGIKEIEH